MAKRISGIEIAIKADTTGVTKSLNEVTTQSVNLSKHLKTVDNLLKLDPGNTELLAQRQRTLSESIETTAKKLKVLEGAQADVKAQFDRGDIGTAQYLAFQEELVRTQKRLESLKKSAEDTAKGVDAVGTEMGKADAKATIFANVLKKLSTAASAAGSMLKTTLAVAAKAAVGAIAGIATAAAGGIAALNGIAESTEEYRIAMGKLNTAYESVGMSAEDAQTAYTGFYKILGDTDTATEASQLLARLTANAEDLTKWTRVAAGVAGTFGDALPIEGLIESANETAKVGQITGSLADALNWVGISEDEFNAKLAAMSTESERNSYIMETLTAQYESAAVAFEKNNAEIIKQRENQAKLDESLAKVGTSVTNIKNKVTGDFMPAIQSVAEGIAAALSGGDFSGIQTGIQMAVEQVGAYLPQIMQLGGTIVSTLAQTLMDNAPQIITGAVQLVTELANGLAAAAPTMLPQVAQLVVDICTALTAPDCLGGLISAALTLITALTQGLMDSLPILISGVGQIVSNILQTLIACLPQILNAGIQIVLSLVDGIVQSLASVASAGKQVTDTISRSILNLIGSAKTWGMDLIDNFVSGIRNTIGKVTSAVQNIAQTVCDYIAFSEPDKGPLSNFHTYAPDMIDNFTGGIKRNAYKIQDQFTKSLSGLSIAANVAGTTAAKAAAPAASAPMQLSVNVNVGSIASDYDTARMTDAMVSQLSHGLAQLRSRQSAALGGV